MLLHFPRFPNSPAGFPNFGSDVARDVIGDKGCCQIRPVGRPPERSYRVVSRQGMVQMTMSVLARRTVARSSPRLFCRIR